MLNKEGRIEKGWGSELIWASTPDYCGKFLMFKKDAKFSMHFHKDKDETWYIMSGKFEIEFIDTKDASTHKRILGVGNTWRNRPLEPHRVTCLEEGTIIEVSTGDHMEDNYRIMAGDSQQ
jgi:mannose-6-phosphate isomerase-like protein (cupin superfamily)